MEAKLGENESKVRPGKVESSKNVSSNGGYIGLGNAMFIASRPARSISI